MDAFERDLQEKYPQLRKWAQVLTRNAVQAEDMVQETILLALQHREQFKPGTNFSGWLHRILRNRFLSEMRKNKTAQAGAELLALLSSEAIDPGQEIAIEQAEVLEEMKKLPAIHQEAIWLVGINGHTYDEAAKLTGVAIGTVKSRVNRARESLTEACQTHGKQDCDMSNPPA
jgi:RNA polymerase sigma-70 factor (ECF subfamily)